jgi:hypothetical protein
MTYERFTVVLTEPEMKILRKLAQKELRRPRDQATYLLRTALLDATPSTDGNAQRVTVASPPCAAEPLRSR